MTDEHGRLTVKDFEHARGLSMKQPRAAQCIYCGEVGKPGLFMEASLNSIEHRAGCPYPKAVQGLLEYLSQEPPAE